jgi:hypothetical protein
MKPHKHAVLIKAWADGAEIEYKSKFLGTWHLFDGDKDAWVDDYEYRIKPEPRPDIMVEVYLQYNTESGVEMWKNQGVKNVRLLFDWYTGELKDAVVIK